MAKATHFEIPVDDIQRAKTFYQDALGYDYQPWGDEMGMLTEPSEDGIGGDLHLRAGVPHPTIVFEVDRIEDTLELVKAKGGEQVGEILPIDETSRYVYVKDSEGNLIGLFDGAVAGS